MPPHARQLGCKLPCSPLPIGSDLAHRVGRPKGSLFGRLCFLVVPAMLLANCFATAFLARSSFANYPGGSALHAFNQLFASEEHGTYSRLGAPAPLLTSFAHQLLLPQCTSTFPTWPHRPAHPSSFKPAVRHTFPTPHRVRLLQLKHGRMTRPRICPWTI